VKETISGTASSEIQDVQPIGYYFTEYSNYAMTTLHSKYGRGEEHIKIFSRNSGSKKPLRTLGMYDMIILK
jgi:hypothetical protein